VQNRQFLCLSSRDGQDKVLPQPHPFKAKSGTPVPLSSLPPGSSRFRDLPPQRPFFFPFSPRLRAHPWRHASSLMKINHRGFPPPGSYEAFFLTLLTRNGDHPRSSFTPPPWRNRPGLASLPSLAEGTAFFFRFLVADPKRTAFFFLLLERVSSAAICRDDAPPPPWAYFRWALFLSSAVTDLPSTSRFLKGNRILFFSTPNLPLFASFFLFFLPFCLQWKPSTSSFSA